MCLDLASNYTEKIATEDMKVYVVRKLVKGKILSPYRKFKWELKKIYQARSRKNIDDYLKRIYGGFFHSFKCLHMARIERNNFLEYFNRPLKYYKIYLAVIPKGTKYYSGTFNLTHGIKAKAFASDKLKLIKEVK